MSMIVCFFFLFSLLIGGQSYLHDHLHSLGGHHFRDQFGDKNGKILVQGLSGCLIGIGEIFLLPLDIMKIKKQTNPHAFGEKHGMEALKFISHQGFRSLYAGATTTGQNKKQTK